MFVFYVFRHIEISERKVACLFSMFFRRKEMSEQKVACLFSMFLGVKKCLSEKLLVCSLCVLGVLNFFIKKNKNVWNWPNDVNYITTTGHSASLIRLPHKLLTSVKRGFALTYSFFFTNISFPSIFIPCIVWLVDRLSTTLSWS